MFYSVASLVRPGPFRRAETPAPPEGTRMPLRTPARLTTGAAVAAAALLLAGCSAASSDPTADDAARS